ncbi:DUF4890 domain-containing protein [Aestuariibaculum suncheonense]|uniref:DUF4890 domain-containing protein n=1 Tax=Aestuariibaculum suncheonense TaxID=1028745 RepID=A0A8J6UBL0_9FLAO|nr:DUF4890 domain-containing protein [Aestuariibaculum suncheonense]MBD0835995.1 DUF4890 domain-containing protein [Aestuariibaculum suncheonense]
MKKIIAIAITLISLQGIAQERRQFADRMDRPHKMSNLTPEQAATLRTKQMTLHYDLTKSQQDEIYKLNLENANTRKDMMIAVKAKKESGEFTKPTSEERYKMMNDRLDHQIAVKTKMKSILTKEQYAKWEDSQAKMKQRGQKMKKEMAQRKFESKKDRR